MILMRLVLTREKKDVRAHENSEHPYQLVQSRAFSQQFVAIICDNNIILEANATIAR